MSVKVAKVERFMRIDRNDEAYLAFDIDADLTSAFTWQGHLAFTSRCATSPVPFFYFFPTVGCCPVELLQSVSFLPLMRSAGRRVIAFALSRITHCCRVR